MAYGNYGAEVYCNGKRRYDKEDCVLFETDPNPPEHFSDYCHGVLGDGNIRVKCYKQGLPSIFELQDGVKKEIEIPVPDDFDSYEYDLVMFEYKGYKFQFEKGDHYMAYMLEPDGTQWQCYYDYDYYHCSCYRCRGYHRQHHLSQIPQINGGYYG